MQAFRVEQEKKNIKNNIVLQSMHQQISYSFSWS